jgi:hypothetical protein
MKLTPEQYRSLVARKIAPKLEEREVPEKAIQNEVEAWLKSLGNGISWSRNRMDRATTCTVGQPDFLIASKPNEGASLWPRGGFYAIEIKRRGQKVKQHQREQLVRWELAGATVGVAHSLEEVKAIMGVTE